MCMDPLADQMSEEFEEIMDQIGRSTRDAIWQRTDLFSNCEPGEEMRLPYRIKQSIEYSLRNYGDFAQFCPMFQQREGVD